MSEADNLLATLSVDYTDEAYVYVNDDRTIMVPDELKHIAVEHDHNIETVTFDCPMYWDEHNLADKRIYINYMRPDGYKDSYPVTQIYQNEEDDARFLFDWTISANVTKIKGNLSFLICIEDADANPRWHSRLNQQMIIDEGLSCTTQIEMAPDSIEEVLARTTASYIAEAKAAIEGKTALSLASIPEDYTTVNNMAEEALREKANTIKMETEGETITVSDSADNALLGLKIFGKTTQVTTTGAQLIPYPYHSTSNATDEVRWVMNNDRSISVSGTASVQRWYALALYLPLTAGTYTVSGCPSGGAYNKYWLYIQRKSDGYVWYEVGDGLTFEVTADDSFDIVVNVGPEAGSVSNLTFYPMLSSGSDAKAYEFYSGGFASPSPNWPQELVSIGDNSGVTTYVAGRNLFRNATSTTTRNGITFTVNQDGSVLVNGTATETVQLDLGTFVPVVGYKYIFTSGQTVGTSGAAMYASGINGVADWKHHRHEWTAITTDSIRLAIYVTSGRTVNNCTLYPMIQITSDNVDETYEPYRDVQTVLPSSANLPGIPVPSGGNYTDTDGQQWVCDEIDFERGVYVQRIYDMAFTGNETVSREDPSTWSDGCYIVYTGKDHPNHVHGECMCTFLPAHSNADIVDGKFECGIGTHGRPNLLVRFSKDINTLESFQAAWDSAIAAGGKVYCILATPIETPLTDFTLANFKMVRSNYPSTTVLNDSGAHMSIKYAGDTKTYVDNNSLTNGILVDTATGKAYRLAVTNGQLTLVVV